MTHSLRSKQGPAKSKQSLGTEVIAVFCFTDRKDCRNEERSGQTSGEHTRLKSSDLTSPAVTGVWIQQTGGPLASDLRRKSLLISMHEPGCRLNNHFLHGNMTFSNFCRLVEINKMHIYFERHRIHSSFWSGWIKGYYNSQCYIFSEEYSENVRTVGLGTQALKLDIIRLAITQNKENIMNVLKILAINFVC